MPLQKQNLSINFSQGLDTKSDPFQLPPGKFLVLENTVFSKDKLLAKRNGFKPLTAAPASTIAITTYQGSLTGVSTQLASLLQADSTWITKGLSQQMSLSTVQLATPTSTTANYDSAISVDYNMVLVTWQDAAGNSWYQIQDLTTGQVIKATTQLTSGANNPKAFQLGIYFIVTYTRSVTGTPHLQYISIPVTSLTAAAAVDISTSVAAATSAYDGYVANNKLFLAWNGADVGGALRLTTLSATLTVATAVAIATYDCTNITVTADTSINNPVVYFTFLETTNLRTIAYNTSLVNVLALTTLATSVSNLITLTSAATGGVLTVLQQYSNSYSWTGRSDLIKKLTCTQAGAVSSNTTKIRSVGLASKAFFIPSYGTTPLMLVAYGTSASGLLQPTYFVVDANGSLLGKLAYTNGGGALNVKPLPNVNIDGEIACIPYLFKEILQAANPESLTPPSSTTNIYAQTGIRLCAFNFAPGYVPNVEIGETLSLGAGLVLSYDGVSCAEQSFVLFPEDLNVTTVASGGSIAASTYYYAATYEWTDAKNNINRSAPSVPAVIVVGAGSSTNTIKIPTIRITNKPATIRIVLYRWSTAQPVFYQVTSITSPTANDTTADSVTITDTAADATILGSNILYTTGGVIENISPPSSPALTLFKDRAWLIDAENKNVLWFSKQVIDATPLEFSDLLTLFIAPTLGSQGSTGEMRAIAPMDDKLIIFKKGAIYYLVGTGPDNTGANNDFSDPIFITSTVGSDNPASVILIPQGLIFQSDKGLWLLGRDLSTSYVGAPVEAFNSQTVTSAVTIPGTNQVRFTLDNNLMLVYDYYYDQWATFTAPVDMVSSTVFGGLHTYLNTENQVMQETPGVYMDADTPVLISVATGWLNLAGVQGFQRAYEFTLLGQYYSPHQIYVNVGYDYGSPSHTSIINPNPTNYSDVYGAANLSGSTPTYGGHSNLEQWRIFFNHQKTESIQIILTEVYDNSYGVTPGAGFTLSGINLVVGTKKGYFPLPAARTVG